MTKQAVLANWREKIAAFYDATNELCDASAEVTRELGFDFRFSWKMWDEFNDELGNCLAQGFAEA